MEAPPPHKYGTGSRSDRVWLITNLLTSAAVVCVMLCESESAMQHKIILHAGLDKLGQRANPASCV